MESELYSQYTFTKKTKNKKKTFKHQKHKTTSKETVQLKKETVKLKKGTLQLTKEEQTKPQKQQLYFEKKRDGHCRMHAINNALGGEYLQLAQFWNLCDAYDKLHHTSGSRTFFIVSDANDNLLSWILSSHFDRKTVYFAPGTSTIFTEDQLESCEAILAFSYSHVWAYRKHEDKWYCLNNLHNSAKQVCITKIGGDKFGYILIKQQSKKKSSKSNTSNNQSSNEDSAP
jgi:hypothetical protein